MPKPSDFGIDWQDAELAEAFDVSAFRGGFVAGARGIDSGEGMARAARYKAQKKLYDQALAAWQQQVSQIAEAIRTNK